MKKFIIMGLIFAFGLASCGKAKKKCDEGEELKDGECVEEAKPAEEAKLAYITNKLASNAKVESGSSSVELAQNECAAVKEAEIAAVKVSVGEAVVCDNSADANNKCLEAESYNIQAKAAGGGNELVKADQPSDVSTCKALAVATVDPEYTITNLIAAGDVKVEVGSQSVTLASAAPAGTAAADGKGCFKVKKSQVANLKIVQGVSTLCDSASDTDKCLEDNMEVNSNAAGAVDVIKAASANASCTAVLGGS